MNFNISNKGNLVIDQLLMWHDYEAKFIDGHTNVPSEVAYHISRNNIYDIDPGQGYEPYNPDSWRKEKRIIWSCNFAAANGFGFVAERTVGELIKLGVDVRNPGSLSSNFVMGGEYVDELVLQSLGKVTKPDCLEIQHCQPPAIHFDITQRIWTYTMFETNKLPKRWINCLNQVERILVPSSWLVKSWKEQGVKPPINVIGHGIDPGMYHYIDRPERETFTFLHWGQLATRKGSDLVWRAFVEEFKGDPNVKLILKNIYPFFPCPLDLPNVEYIHATYSRQEMLGLLERSDCFLFPTRGEGFGLTGLEAMATGLPSIITNWSGPADYIDPEDTLLLKYHMSRSIDFDKIYEDHLEPGEDTGEWAEPDFEHLKYLMRFAYEHRDDIKKMGKKAALRLAKDFTWEAQIGKLYSLIDKQLG